MTPGCRQVIKTTDRDEKITSEWGMCRITVFPYLLTMCCPPETHGDVINRVNWVIVLACGVKQLLRGGHDGKDAEMN